MTPSVVERSGGQEFLGEPESFEQALWHQRSRSAGGPIMATRYKLSAYVAEALDEAVYQRMDRGGFTGRIPSCPGVEAVGRSLLECEDELRSTLEEWIVVEMRLRRPLPVLNGIDLNQEPSHEPLDAV